jgi:hypothetical protein
MTFKPLNENDVVNTRTLLHEAIPLTGSIISGSYVDTTVSPYEPTNLKSYAHGMFQTVYDYNYLSSSANHIFDVTCGVSAQSAHSPTTMIDKKKNIYGQMAQLLMGYDLTGSVQLFDEDGDLLGSVNDKIKEVFVLPFSRLLVKDEIKKETFSMTLDVSDYVSSAQPFTSNTLVTIADTGASTEYRVNSPAGDYGILYATSTNINLLQQQGSKCGLIFYQAGIVVLNAEIFDGLLNTGLDGNANQIFHPNAVTTPYGLHSCLVNGTINELGDALLHRIGNIQFNNIIELNSTVYFCRVNHNEFNYSSNPTYTEDSRIRVKTQSTDEPVAYITTVGLYNDRNELLATAKLSEALKKSPSTEFTIRARLDY